MLIIGDDEHDVPLILNHFPSFFLMYRTSIFMQIYKLLLNYHVYIVEPFNEQTSFKGECLIKSQYSCESEKLTVH